MGVFTFFKNKKNNATSENDNNKLGTEEDFAWNRSENGIGLKSSLTEYAALKNGLAVERLSKGIILVISESGIQHSFINMNGDRSSRVGMYLCDRKHDARHILKQQGLSVIESDIFGLKDLEKAKEYVDHIGFPIVVKPINLSRARGITTNIQTFEGFEKAWGKAFDAYRKNRSSNKILIERHFTGEDYRFYVVGDRLISATHRKRPNVTGDGTSTVLELIKSKNVERAENPYLSKNLIPEDISELDALTDNNIELDYIPDDGQLITLRKQSNIWAGGDNIDVTDTAHQDFKELAIKTIQSIPGIEYGGMDFIAPDVTVKPNDSNYIVSEVEFSPAPLAHFPYIGKRRDMAGAVIDHYFGNDQ
ncbi:hypothetical protein KFZ58_16240 [Virgibacillus sp. NKC19-16]|uniref:ATP-binding protein n=1 Tax=Virgibacillus salidurans TaxID=2831673 RepID=UPI001F274B7D|nr:hypothetical protein [Virgibacillus sp. NKC19-16]UJL45902.1 hypothetical protein KFZ58_16240 [Virgibacillus sp. NKC19-16]